MLGWAQAERPTSLPSYDEADVAHAANCGSAEAARAAPRTADDSKVHGRRRRRRRRRPMLLRQPRRALLVGLVQRELAQALLEACGLFDAQAPQVEGVPHRCHKKGPPRHHPHISPRNTEQRKSPKKSKKKSEKHVTKLAKNGSDRNGSVPRECRFVARNDAKKHSTNSSGASHCQCGKTNMGHWQPFGEAKVM